MHKSIGTKELRCWKRQRSFFSGREVSLGPLLYMIWEISKKFACGVVLLSFDECIAKCYNNNVIEFMSMKDNRECPWDI